MASSSSTLHIALFIPTLSGGGAERVFVQLANGLAAAGVRVDLLAGRRGHYESHVSESVRLISFDKPRSLATVPSLRRYMRQGRPDAIISTLSDGNVAMLLAGLSIRRRPALVVRETVMISENLKATPKTRLLKALTSLLYPRADGIVSLSKGVAEELERTIPGLRGRVKVIYNPGPSDQELTLGGDPLPQFVEAKQRGPVFVALGRLSEQKDNATLIRAFARVRAVRPSTLWILGEGEERARLEQLASDLGVASDVFMPGFASNPYPYLIAADVFVMSSRYEGGPSAMLQAMGCGCKIVSTDAPSGPAEFLEHGRHGHLVPVGDDAAFGAAMLSALDEPFSPELREEGMQRFKPAFVAAEYQRFLQSVVDRVRTR